MRVHLETLFLCRKVICFPNVINVFCLRTKELHKIFYLDDYTGKSANILYYCQICDKIMIKNVMNYKYFSRLMSSNAADLPQAQVWQNR
jgi:hypothetical protein